jgi:hypothetical protein
MEAAPMSDVRSYLIIDAKVLSDEATFDIAIRAAWSAVRRYLEKNLGDAQYVAVEISGTLRNSAELETPR